MDKNWNEVIQDMVNKEMGTPTPKDQHDKAEALEAFDWLMQCCDSHNLTFGLSAKTQRTIRAALSETPQQCQSGEVELWQVIAVNKRTGEITPWVEGRDNENENLRGYYDLTDTKRNVEDWRAALARQPVSDTPNGLEKVREIILKARIDLLGIKSAIKPVIVAECVASDLHEALAILDQQAAPTPPLDDLIRAQSDLHEKYYGPKRAGGMHNTTFETIRAVLDAAIASHVKDS